jgi:hypothetical protein
VPEPEIAGERRAFDAAIQRIEAEMEREGMSGARASSRTFKVPQITRVEPESVPTILLGEVRPEAAAGNEKLPAHVEQRIEVSQPHLEVAQADPTDRTLGAEDFRLLPQDTAPNLDLKFAQRSPSAVTPPNVRRRLKRMMIAIVCCLVVTALYFSTTIKGWLGL